MPQHLFHLDWRSVAAALGCVRRTKSTTPALLANMQIFVRCGGVHGTLALDVNPWETVWSAKRDVLRRLGAPDTRSDAVRAIAQIGVYTQQHLVSTEPCNPDYQWLVVHSVISAGPFGTTKVHSACE